MKSYLSGEERLVKAIGHVPILEKVIRDDLIKNESNTKIQDNMLTGITEWKNANGGFWSKSIKDVISMIEKGMGEKQNSL
jgi:hypothetical protein